MKRYVVVLAMAIALLGGTSGIAATKNEHVAGTSPATVEDTKAPRAEVSDPKFTFDPVMEGTEITHDFSVKNTGDGPLAITRVKTG